MPGQETALTTLEDEITPEDEIRINIETIDETSQGVDFTHLEIVDDFYKLKEEKPTSINNSESTIDSTKAAFQNNHNEINDNSNPLLGEGNAPSINGNGELNCWEEVVIAGQQPNTDPNSENDWESL